MTFGIVGLPPTRTQKRGPARTLKAPGPFMVFIVGAGNFDDARANRRYESNARALIPDVEADAIEALLKHGCKEV